MDGISLKTLKTGKVSRRRNPLIADLLRRIHLVEAWGRSIRLILDKAPDVSFHQTAGIFITEFPRPVPSKEIESGAQSNVIIAALVGGFITSGSCQSGMPLTAVHGPVPQSLAYDRTR